jgi:hypothetical protein
VGLGFTKASNNPVTLSNKPKESSRKLTRISPGSEFGEVEKAAD